LDIRGFDPAGPAGNLNAVRHFATAGDLRTEIVNARIWAGVHYRFSGEAGVRLGMDVAPHDLANAFQGHGDKQGVRGCLTPAKVSDTFLGTVAAWSRPTSPPASACSRLSTG